MESESTADSAGSPDAVTAPLSVDVDGPQHLGGSDLERALRIATVAHVLWNSRKLLRVPEGLTLPRVAAGLLRLLWDHHTAPIPLEPECSVRHYQSVSDLVYYLNHAEAVYNNTAPAGTDIVFHCWEAAPFRPAYYAALDHGKRAVVLAIRGTASVADGATDATSLPCSFLGGYAHAGMANCAMWFHTHLADKLAVLLGLHKGFGLRVVGHSLGAGTAVLLTARLLAEGRFGAHDTQCFAYATPAIACQTLLSKITQLSGSRITSVVLEFDCVPRLSLCAGNRLLERLHQEAEKHEAELEALGKAAGAGVAAIRGFAPGVGALFDAAAARISAASDAIASSRVVGTAQQIATVMDKVFTVVDPQAISRAVVDSGLVACEGVSPFSLPDGTEVTVEPLTAPGAPFPWGKLCHEAVQLFTAGGVVLHLVRAQPRVWGVTAVAEASSPLGRSSAAGSKPSGTRTGLTINLKARSAVSSEVGDRTAVPAPLPPPPVHPDASATDNTTGRVKVQFKFSSAAANLKPSAHVGSTFVSPGTVASAPAAHSGPIKLCFRPPSSTQPACASGSDRGGRNSCRPGTHCYALVPVEPASAVVGLDTVAVHTDMVSQHFLSSYRRCLQDVLDRLGASL